MANLTIEDVKRELPDVNVRLSDGTITVARVIGRKLPFARLVIEHGDSVFDMVTYEAAWATVAHALNNEEAIII